MNLIRLNCPVATGDGRTALSGTTSDKVSELQRQSTALKLEIQREKQRRLKAERELASMRPSEAQLMALLFQQVAGTSQRVAA